MSTQPQIIVNAQVKVKDRRITALCSAYEQRISRFMPVSRRAQTDPFSVTKKQRSGSQPMPVIVLLDARGDLLDSPTFAQRLKQCVAIERKSMMFNVGGPDGFTKAQCNLADHVVSFGRMTIANQVAQLLLFEQLYRAITIIQGHPYHAGHNAQ